MVGYDVDEKAQVVAPERFSEATEGSLAAQLSAEAVVIGDVVPMGSVGTGLEKRRGVAVADAKRGKVWHEAGSVVEGQIGTELKPVSGQGHAQQRVGVGDDREQVLFP